MEWLHEAMAETYLPLLRVLGRLERDKIGFHANLILSPILLEQLGHPTFREEFPRYLTRKIVAAQEDEAFFEQSREAVYAKQARYWQSFFSEARDDFQALGGDLIAEFRRFRDVGMLDLLTSPATHGYLPLLGTDESVRAQVRLAVETHQRYLGQRPRGIWSPECGYRPAGLWSYPIVDPDRSDPFPAFERVGLEQVFAEAGLELFYVDAHLIESARTVNSGSSKPTASDDEHTLRSDRQLYQPYVVAGVGDVPSAVSVFPRDPRTAVQVWSSETGYPAEPAYLDFHKKRWPGGHRYWRVTDAHGDLQHKEPYDAVLAAERVRSHGAHFAHTLWQTLSPTFSDPEPAILSAPFDAELFGHWWFEGPAWIEAVARTLHEHAVGVTMATSAEYLDHFPPAGVLALEEGSWGAGGDHRVWLNLETAWTWNYVYEAERFVRDVATAGAWRNSQLARRIMQQICRELLLLESSDWQSLITTGAARDYAEARFLTHHEQLRQLREWWNLVEAGSELDMEQMGQMEEIERRDAIFADLDPGLWATSESPALAGNTEQGAHHAEHLENS